MPYKDMPLTCQACGSPFYFTAGEQEFYADKGFLHEPTRCPTCRSSRNSGRGGGRDGGSTRAVGRRDDNRPRRTSDE